MLDDRDATPHSQAQIEAGNYPKGHVYAHGMRISIENPAGSIRQGKSKEGEEWASRLQHDYGYVRGSTGRDGDHIDVFLGPEYKDRDVPVHVIDQHDPDNGKFDEHKAMLGFRSERDAVAAYHANYPHDWNGARAVTPLHVDEFKRWATSPGARHKALAGHLGVKRHKSGPVKKYAQGGSVQRFEGGGDVGWDSTPKQPVAPAAPDPYIKVEGAGPVSHQAMAEAWNANRKDPAKVYELMQQNGVGVNQAAKFLGVDNDSMANYLNSGRSRGTVQVGAGDDMSFKEDYKYGYVTPEAQTRSEFDATVEPWMIDEQGKFKRPHDGVNYQWEGMTPAEVFATRQPKVRDPLMDRDGFNGTGFSDAERLPGHRSYDAINLKWEPGYDNGGGVLGGMVRAVGNMGTNIAKNPALMAALTAGIGSMMAPAAQAGATAGGVGTGGSAGIGSGTTLGGGAASSAWAPVQSFMASPYAQPALSAVKTVAAGGSPMDALKSAGTTYIGGQLGDAAVAANPMPGVFSPQVVRYLTNSLVSGRKINPISLAQSVASGEANRKPTKVAAHGGHVARLPELNTVVQQLIHSITKR